MNRRVNRPSFNLKELLEPKLIFPLGPLTTPLEPLTTEPYISTVMSRSILKDVLLLMKKKADS